jgi:hypothetical protein
VAPRSRGSGNACSALTAERDCGIVGDMGVKLQRLDADRRRRRLQLLAELADAKAVRVRVQPGRVPGYRIRGLIELRRRLAG